MEQIVKWVKLGCAGLSAVGVYIWGGADTLMIVLILMIVLDYLTGVAASYVLKTTSSNVGFKGIIKKLLYFVVVAVAYAFDKLLGLDGVLRATVIGFLAANEGISILENAGNCGLPIPKALLDALAQLKKDGDGKDKE